MTRQLGRASLLGGALCWVLLALALGLAQSLLFLLYFTGFGFALGALFG